jgi:carboxyl-terminal processing protease
MHPIRAIQIGLISLVFAVAVFGQDRLQNPKTALIKMEAILSLIDANYYKEVDLDKCAEAILKKGISECLDPYSAYHPAQETSHQQDDMKGHFGGVGIRFEGRKNQNGGNEFIVVSTLKNTPAEAAGVKEGDRLMAVSTTTRREDAVSLSGVSKFDVVDLIRGEIGTQVLVIINRDGEIKDFLLTRADIKIESIEQKHLKKKVGYINITDFSVETSKDFYIAVSSLTRSGSKVLILDVRGNPGGLLSSVTEIISGFQKDNSAAVYAKKSRGSYYPYELRHREHGKYQKLKVVVLANAYSASASEILSAWFKEDFGAPVVGEKTFGKGSIQTIIPFQDGSSLRLTIAEYFVGNNKTRVHEIGVSTTIEVKNPKSEGKKAEDLQLRRAIEEAEKLLQ